MRASVGHGHNSATYKGSCDLYLGLCLKTLAQVVTRPIFLMKVFDLLHDDGAISEGHFSLNRHWFVADEQLVIHFPVNDHAVDVAELARLDALAGLVELVGLRHRSSAMHQSAEKAHDTALPRGAVLESVKTQGTTSLKQAARLPQPSPSRIQLGCTGRRPDMIPPSRAISKAARRRACLPDAV